MKKERKKYPSGRKRHGLTKHRLYSIWNNMRKRCRYNEGNYSSVSVCEEWEDFLVFYDWANNNGYSDELSIDRIETEDGYSPSNCRWASYETQSQNSLKRKDNKSGFKGVYLDKQSGKWIAKIQHDGKKVYIGRSDSPEESNRIRVEYIEKNKLKHRQ